MRSTIAGSRADGACHVLAAGCIAPGCADVGQAHAQVWRGARSTVPMRRVADDALAIASALPARIAKRMDRFAHLAVAATRSTLAAHAAASLPRSDCGIVVGNMTGGWGCTEPELRKLHSTGLADISPYLASSWFPAAAQGQASIQLGLEGYAKTIATDRCAGGQAIGLGFARIAHGKAEAIVAGGAEAPITPFVEAAYECKFGDRAQLREAAAFLLLSPEAPADQARPRITRHRTRALFHDEPLQAQVREMLAAASEPEMAELALFVNTLPHDRIEAEIEQAVRASGLAVATLMFPNRVLGDSLAASAALAAAVACESLLQAQCSHALVLSVGHQCLDILTLTL
ncbi:hypothetical protein LRH25_19920 [Ideonella azotifigens]|uniref:Beta-ketoacyl synthase-like N-terminal domain-containing protein n=2 Tax=Ideonella azotifigens TaxID=513160 RepID=A0ABN1JZX1_9BURK|nr:beta-ketoacyl synthase N-terminal-like domain-containing protein [Ideonella azotifigens]MCD2342598.1 hypothetical protein [Ideonella azotifigens]